MRAFLAILLDPPLRDALRACARALQAARYEQRLTTLAQAVANLGIDVRLPSGGFYLWCSLAGHDGWSLASLLASRLGVVASPGEFYGPAAMQYLRVAAVADDATCAEVLRRSTT